MDVIKKIKNYTLNERHCLGEGSFGKVYEAHSEDGRRVAIKKVDQKLISSDRYLKESLDNQITIMQKLRHPNIVELYEVIITANNIYLVMEYCAGGDLKGYCKNRKITEEMAFNIIRQVGRGFEEMSKLGIIHRDLKPANILVHNEVFKLCDFGFAKYFGDAGRMTRTCVGTPIYMSPQVLKQKNYTSKTDIWSLGVLFYELLFGKIPFSGYNEDEMYRNIMKSGIQVPPCSKEAETIIRGCLVVEEAKRWGWGELFSALFGSGAVQQVQGQIVQSQPGIKRVAGNKQTPVTASNNGNMFYEADRLDKRVYQPQDPPPLVPMRLPANNYFDEDGPSPPQRPRNDSFRKQPARNIFAMQANQPQQPRQQMVMPGPTQPVAEREQEENPRFCYFVLVELVVNPIESSISFDSFLFTLWRHTLALYERILQKPQVIIAPVYRGVLAAQLAEVKGLESEMRVKKEGSLITLGEIVCQEARSNPANKQKVTWVRRVLERRYSFDSAEG